MPSNYTMEQKYMQKMALKAMTEEQKQAVIEDNLYMEEIDVSYRLYRQHLNRSLNLIKSDMKKKGA
jgi:hypothetical protein